MAPPSRAFADAAAAALRALQCSGPGAVYVATDTSGRRPARQARSAGAPTPIAAGAVPPAPAAPAGDPTLIPAASRTSVDPPPAPPSSPESAAGATETPSPAVPSEEAPDSPPTPPPSASAPPSPTPAPSVMLLVQANAAIAHHADVTQSLEKRTLVAEADSAAALERLRKQLADRDRANVIPARIQALTDENNSLRRVNSILHRHSAAHGLDVDTLVLASAGISAAEIYWNLLGLSPPTVTVESPRHDEFSSEEGEESKTTDVPMAESTEATSAAAASVDASAGSPTVSRPEGPGCSGRRAIQSSFGIRRDFPASSVDAPAQQQESSDVEFGGGMSPSDSSQDDLEPGEIPGVSASAQGVQGSATEPSGTVIEVPYEVSPSAATSIPSPVSSGIAGVGRAPRESAAGVAEGSGGPPDHSPSGESPHESETSEDRAALFLEMFGPDEREETSVAQPVAPSEAPSPLAAATGVPVAPQAATVPLPSRLHTRSASVHARAMVTATVTASPRAGPASIAPAVVDASDVAPGSRKLSGLATLFLEPGFTAPGASECWHLIQNASVPLVFEDDLVAPSSVDGIVEFGLWTDPAHPFQVLRQLFPDEPCLIDTTGFPSSVAISRRATGRALLVRLWRQFQGYSYHSTERGDLGFALWERRHWLRGKAVKAYIDNLASTLGQRNVQVLALRQAWSKYHRERSYRADRLRDQMLHKHRTEVLLEPSYLQYSFEVIEWVPTTDDWASEVADVDAREPWRNCWFQAPADHPYNTACNDVPLFVPNGSTRETVASSVVVESSLRTSMVVAPWVAEFANARRSRSPSPDEETKESGDASSAAGSSLGVLAQAVMEI
ncbi:hypothetical protein PHYSODRAFT_255752 [Phytophthora sojae]|uniref:Uncharacterized protein n=1 Tax=Phytophthora sojae (strain P6497) TaxID=1094619 RepID=G4ZDJ0_PHYSP|nr:hypothetical protein PHYSODRAFT_255752 [Phytophthora sojae]EGZ17840.1 hypothetical protein PHYSODRAFT_255752 [Phytophthora sojae]|eukprot:XP_009526898.1 hypothetical protein PHYSODRAFT_255752 [Phytophthora sojae]